MRRQTSLDNYFKSISNISPGAVKMSDKNNANNTNKKRSSLSDIANISTTKAAKKKSGDFKEISAIDDLIVIISDDENNTSPEIESSNNLSKASQNFEETECSNSDTIIYELTPKTPKKTPKKPFTSSSGNNSGSREKFFSPIKKRTVVIRNPVKKNLNLQYFESSQSSIDNDLFSSTYEGMDDKNTFLLTIINKCLKHESLKSLLDQNSLDILAKCMLLSEPAVRLVCRLYWRQHTWYRYDNVAKISIGKKETVDDPSMLEMLKSLVANGLLMQAPLVGNAACNFDDLIKLLKNHEVKQICKDLKLKIKSKKDGTEALRNFSQQRGITKYITSPARNSENNSSRVLKIMRTKAGPCYKLSDLARSAIYKLYLLMYLGMPYSIIREKKLELMLIYDKINRESYPVDKGMKVDDATVVFRTQDEFERYLKAHMVYEDFLAQTNGNERSNIVLDVFKLYNKIDNGDMMRYKSYPIWLHRYTPAYVYVKILETGVQDLKRGGNFTAAVDVLSTLIAQGVFRQHKMADWFAEKALLLHKRLCLHDEAAKLLLEGLKSDLSNDAIDAMRPQALMIAKRQNTALTEELRTMLNYLARLDQKLEKDLYGDHIYKQPMENYGKGKIKFEVREHGERLVLDAEEYCIWHYKNEGTFTHGGHWEGKIVVTIFFLLFWDIIYTKPVGVTGIFLSHYQQYPLDLYTESFYTNRRVVIDDRLSQIEKSTDESLLQMLRSKWEERPENETSGICREVGWAGVEGVASCLASGQVAALCRRLATNYGYSHSGFPDLTLWNIHTKKIKFVEVKTDSDKPSLKQIQWMHYLRQNHIDTGFCYVGVNTTRSKARAGPSNPGPSPDDSNDDWLKHIIVL